MWDPVAAGWEMKKGLPVTPAGLRSPSRWWMVNLQDREWEYLRHCSDPVQGMADVVPAEADVSIRPGWYYHPEQNNQVRSAQNLIDLYFQSVGRGASLNLGLPPDRRGQLHDNDVNSLKKFGDWQKETFSNNLAHKAKSRPTIHAVVTTTYDAKNVLDGKRESYWCTDDNVLTPEIILDMGKEIEFNIVNIRDTSPAGTESR